VQGSDERALRACAEYDEPPSRLLAAADSTVADARSLTAPSLTEAFDHAFMREEGATYVALCHFITDPIPEQAPTGNGVVAKLDDRDGASAWVQFW
jgi:hypothetical protein